MCFNAELLMVRGVGFEPTQASASGSPHLAGKVLSPPPLAELGHPRLDCIFVWGV